MRLNSCTKNKEKAYINLTSFFVVVFFIANMQYSNIRVKNLSLKMFLITELNEMCIKINHLLGNTDFKPLFGLVEDTLFFQPYMATCEKVVHAWEEEYEFD